MPNKGRRGFLRRLAWGAFGLAFGATAPGCKGDASEIGDSAPEAAPDAPEEREFLSRVVLVRDEDAIDDETLAIDPEVVQRMLAEGMEALFEEEATEAWKSLLSPEDVVGIKMNLMMAATHSEVVRAILQEVERAGVEEENIIVWDRDRVGVGREEMDSKPRSFGYNDDHLHRAVDKCSALINVPGLKAHWLAGIACALKNWVGAVTGINVPDRNVTYAIHADSCAECCRINALEPIRSKCRLIVVDALRPLFVGDPRVEPRHLWNYKGLILGTDPVAVDALGLEILERKRAEFKGEPWPLTPPVTHLTVAEEKYGLGCGDLSQVEIISLGWEEGRLI